MIMEEQKLNEESAKILFELENGKPLKKKELSFNKIIFNKSVFMWLLMNGGAFFVFYLIMRTYLPFWAVLAIFVLIYGICLITGVAPLPGGGGAFIVTSKKDLFDD